MSMSTHVVGFRPPDEKWTKMKTVWESCRSANIEPPDEVVDFFDGEYPGDAPGQEVKLGDAAEEWGNDYCSGFQVAVEKLPKNIKFIRFYNSY